MPVGPSAAPDAQLVRRVRVVRGQLPLEVECRPAFDYARARHASAVNEHGARFDGPGLSLGLAASVPLRADGGGAVAAFPLGEGQSATFVLQAIAPDAHPDRCPGTQEAEDGFRETVAYWQRWAARCTYRGRWRETVLRSALALKLLTYQPTGAIVAAPTTSLPEGGRRGAELGLPLHLDPRRRVHGVRLPARRLHRGGGPLPGLAGRPLQ